MLLPVLLISALAWGPVLGVAQTAGDTDRSPAETTVERVGHLGGDSQGIVVSPASIWWLAIEV
ncbi:MAG: hypothetical protein JXM73_20645, partial [Anaerolineae bacterium]|nr:hypothetical protein [Anaerolineae bacterium]